jgi:hypothetical protein
MKSFRAGQLVTVAEDEGASPAIVFDTSHLPRVVVASLDDDEQAVLRTVALGRLRPRRDGDPADRRLREFISAASAEARAGAPGSGGNVLKGRPAHSGPRMHRPTGR